MGKILRVIVYLLLVLSAGTTFFFPTQLWTAVRAGGLPIWIAALPSICFVGFVFVYTIDRWFLVWKQNYPPVRALLQVAFAIIFLTTVLPEQATSYRQAKVEKMSKKPINQLLGYKDPIVRSLACELVGWRGQVKATPRITHLAENDESGKVRLVCSEALNKLMSINQVSPQIPQP